MFEDAITNAINDYRMADVAVGHTYGKDMIVLKHRYALVPKPKYGPDLYPEDVMLFKGDGGMSSDNEYTE